MKDFALRKIPWVPCLLIPRLFIPEVNPSRHSETTVATVNIGPAVGRSWNDSCGTRSEGMGNIKIMKSLKFPFRFQRKTWEALVYDKVTFFVKEPKEDDA